VLHLKQIVYDLIQIVHDFREIVHDFREIVHDFREIVHDFNGSTYLKSHEALYIFSSCFVNQR